MLVVSEVCAGRCCSRRVGEGSTRGQERVVGRSTARAAVGVAEAQRLRRGDIVSQGFIGKKNPDPIWHTGGMNESRAYFINSLLHAV